VAVRDWVLNGALWRQASIGGQTYNPNGTLDAGGEFTILPLTFNRNNQGNDTDLAVPELASSMTAVQTLGYVHWHLTVDAKQPLANLYLQNWRAILSMRITRWPQEPNGATVGDLPGYDLVNVESANDHFVWSWEKHLLNQTSNDWLGTSGSKAPLGGTVRINAKYKRRIETNECMVLIVQFLQGNQPGNQPWQDVSGQVFVDWTSHLRTFVNADTM